MTLIPVGHFIAQSQIQTPAAGGPALVVTGHEQVAAGNANTMASFVAQAWGAAGSLAQQMGAGFTLDQVTTYVNDGGPDPAVGLWTGAHTGTTLGEASPPQVSLLIRKSTGLAGRRNRGRMYMPGLMDAQVKGDGTLQAADLTDWQNAASEFFSQLTALGVPMVILHETLPDTATPISTLIVANLVATQRRRLR